MREGWGFGQRGQGDHVRPPRPGGLTTKPYQAVAASLSFFIGRTLTFTVAGFALKTVS